jgi:hypothetical protein
MTAHNQWLSKTRSIPYWTTSVFSSAMTDLVLIYESVTSSASIVRWLTLHSLNTQQLNWTELNWTTELTQQSQSQSHIATDGQSVSKPLCRAPSGAHDQIFIMVWQLRSCFCRRPLWREDGSVFCIFSFPCQRSLSSVGVPWDSRYPLLRNHV